MNSFRGKLRIGVLGCSEFAARAMIPAMKDIPETELVAIASRTASKAKEFAERFGCDAVEGYQQMLDRPDIEAVYIPLPPGLHEKWIDSSLEAGKHVLVEKPFVPDEAAANRLIQKARSRRLLIVENILFPHHSLFTWVREKIRLGVLGEVRLFRCSFTIPELKPVNFRYDAMLGGGALLDMGPYLVRFSTAFLGEPLTLHGVVSRHDSGKVDIFSAAMFADERGQFAQVACGFDMHYQCVWEFLGTQAKLTVERAFTPPPGFAPVVRIERQNHREEIPLPADNHYMSMCRYFARAIQEGGSFEVQWNALATQAKYLQMLRTKDL